MTYRGGDTRDSRESLEKRVLQLEMRLLEVEETLELARIRRSSPQRRSPVRRRASPVRRQHSPVRKRRLEHDRHIVISPTGVHVRNIPPDMTKQDVIDSFVEQFGPITSIHDKDDPHWMNVIFETAEAAKMCLNAVHPKIKVFPYEERRR